MATIKVLMAGGRRCGKTTTLSAMYENIDDALDGSNLTMHTNQDLANKLVETINVSEGYFDNVDPQNFIQIDDSNATQDVRHYAFDIKLKNTNAQKDDKNMGLTVEFIDVPGEYFDKDNIHYQETQNLIAESPVLLIAIDAPCLMEDKKNDGTINPRHSSLNQSDRITNFITSHSSGGMVLFVPIKCEKYYYAGRMKELADAVKLGYGTLINFINENNYTAAILPIISLGGLEFFSFVNEDLEMTSPTASERFTYRQCESERKYLPKYCEQPLLYTLAFFVKILQLGNWRNGFWNNLANRFFGIPNLQVLLNEFSKLNVKMNRNEEEGFEMINNPLGI